MPRTFQLKHTHRRNARPTMNRPTFDLRQRPTTLALILILSASLLSAGSAPLTGGGLLAIEPSTTWAGFARVHLEIQDLRQTGGVLEGTYQIRVPLSPRQDDTGRVVLRVSESIEELAGRAATVTGSAHSATGQVNDVVVQMKPNGVVRIQVTTPKRTLKFKSRYASLRG